MMDLLDYTLEPLHELIVDVVPELKLIVGEQPAVPELTPQDARVRLRP